MLERIKIVNREIIINPLTLKNNNYTANHFLDLLLKTLRKNPASIIKKIVFERLNTQYYKLDKTTQKLEKARHISKKTNLLYEISYLVPLPLDNTKYWEIKLTCPLKTQKINSPERVGDSYVVIDETLGDGGFSIVKGAHLSYWYDAKDNLNHSKLDVPIARKTFRPEKIANRLPSFDLAYVNNVVNLEIETGKEYLGNEKFDLYKYKTDAGHERFDIAMPQIPTTLLNAIETGKIGKLNYSSRFKIIHNIAIEISKFHKKTGKVHHDIKPGNIGIDLATDLFPVTLIDYNLVNKISNRWHGYGTRFFIDPKLKTMNGRNSDISNDYYALALVCVLLLIAPYENDPDEYFLQEIITLQTISQVTKNAFENALKHLNIPLFNQICDLLNEMTSTEKPIAGDKILQRLNDLYEQFYKMETCEPKNLTGLNDDQEFSLAKTQLLVTCADNSKDALMRQKGLEIIEEVETIKSNQPTAPLPKLTNVLNKTRNVIDNPNQKNIIEHQECISELKKFPWAKLLIPIMEALLGFALFAATFCSLALLVITGGASSAITLLGFDACTTLLSSLLTISAHTVSIGAGMGFFIQGVQTLFTKVDQNSELNKLQEKMQELDELAASKLVHSP